MSNLEDYLSAAAIGYLLAINELDDGQCGVRSSLIAQHLGISKPSVHTMIMKLCEKGYTTKETYGPVHLTASGRQLAQTLSGCYALLDGRVQGTFGLSPKDCRTTICTVLSQMGQDKWDRLYETLCGQCQVLVNSLPEENADAEDYSRN